jgi:hypothetical protein
MATTRTAPELRRSAYIALIYRAFRTRMPDLRETAIGLEQVAELCKRDCAARPGRDWHWVRDNVLIIAAEWELSRDRLEEQSIECLRTLAKLFG